MRIVAFAYACEPGEGSEPGAGWAWSRMLADLGETWVITRSNNRERIESGRLTADERARLHFEYVDLPSWARWWKRGRRGLFPYYVLWQAAALRRARSLHRSNPFDAAWHLTLANVWMGSAAPFLRIPTVYGPVGGGVAVPAAYLSTLGLRGAISEVARRAIRDTARVVNPLARAASGRASVILVQNRETAAWLPRRDRGKALVFPHVVLDDPPAAGHRTARDVALFAGRLLPWKGVVLAIDALVDLPGWTLVVCGTGPDERRLRAHARRRGMGDRVRFVGAVPRAEVRRLMAEEAEVFLFPSLREEAGWVVPEAIAAGLPVVCLDHGGPPILGGTPVALVAPRRLPHDLARAVLATRGRAPVDPPDYSFATRLASLRPAVAGVFGHNDRRAIRSGSSLFRRRNTYPTTTSPDIVSRPSSAPRSGS